MASSVDRRKFGKHLCCFYCGKRSGLKQDGFVRHWECIYCEAENYLDENGEITDPPVATTAVTPPKVQFAVPRADSPSSMRDTSPFCSDCQKNQHLFAACLAQYVPKDEAQLYDREYYKFRANLEKTYPQICEDCEAGVFGKIKEANRSAATDHMRRLMDKTRLNRNVKSKKSWTEVSQFWGGVLWWLSLACQVAGNLVGLLESILPYMILSCEAESPHLEDISLEESRFSFAISRALSMLCCTTSFMPPSFDNLNVLKSRLLSSGLFLCLISFWWNPKYRQWVRGFHSQIKGFGEWYKYQIILIATRILFHYLASSQVFSEPVAPATRALHIFMIIFILIVTFFAQKSITIDPTPLFSLTPEKLRPFVQRKNPSADVDMNNALDEIVQGQSFYASPGQSSAPENQRNLEQDHGLRRPENQNTYQLPGGISLPGVGEELSLSDMTDSEATEYLKSGHVPARIRAVQSQQIDEMDWDPEPPTTLRINQPQILLRSHQSSHPPPDPQHSSAFWYRVPPAPVGPAHMLRNPPNRPRLQARTAEAKQNFFDSMMRPAYSQKPPGSPEADQPLRHEVEFAQPKFFPPPPASDVLLNGLAEIFGSVKLKTESEVNTSPVVIHNSLRDWARTLQHTGLAGLFLVSLIFWHSTPQHTPSNFQRIELCAFLFSGAVAMRSITDYTVSDWSRTNSPMKNALGATLSGIEAAVAGYGLLEAMVRLHDAEGTLAYGSVLLFVMLIHEVWNAVF